MRNCQSANYVIELIANTKSRMTDKNRILLISSGKIHPEFPGSGPIAENHLQSEHQGGSQQQNLPQQLSPEQKLLFALEQAGFATSSLALVDLATELKTTHPGDILIFNLGEIKSQPAFDAANQLSLAIKSNPKTSSVKILCVGVALEQSGTSNQNLSTTDHAFDDLICGPLRIPSVLSRIKSLTRANAIHNELNRRSTINLRYGMKSSIEQPSDTPLKNATILVTGRSNGFARIEQTLSPHATLIGASSIDAAKDYLKRHPFDMLIINGGKSPTRYLELAESLRKNSALYTMPILMIAHPSNLTESHIAYEAGITDIIEAPVNQNELLLRAGTLIRERRFKTAVSNTYLCARHLPTHDALTGLHNYSYFRQHLETMLKDMQIHNRKFSLITITIENMDEINQNHGMAEGDKVIQQISEILMVINRGEDLLSRIKGRRFVISLPDTPAEHAAYVVKRAEGIIKQTQFINQQTMAPISVMLAAEITEADQQSTIQSIINKLPHHQEDQSGSHAA